MSKYLVTVFWCTCLLYGAAFNWWAGRGFPDMTFIDDLPAWVQAVGSVGAILVVIWIDRRTANRESTQLSTYCAEVITDGVQLFRVAANLIVEFERDPRGIAMPEGAPVLSGYQWKQLSRAFKLAEGYFDNGKAGFKRIEATMYKLPPNSLRALSAIEKLWLITDDVTRAVDAQSALQSVAMYGAQMDAEQRELIFDVANNLEEARAVFSDPRLKFHAF